jgi:ATP-dependent DNA helicase RecQ
LLGIVSRPDRTRLRLLASPLRIECEKGSLGEPAASLLLRAASAANGAHDWIPLSIAECGLHENRFSSALRELESRQLVFVDWMPPRCVVDNSSIGRHRLERTVLQLRVRRQAERVKLAAMVGYATSLMCRRKYMLNYFGDRSLDAGGCGGCDVCTPD